MSCMVRICSRELLAETYCMIGGQNLQFERGQFRKSRDGTISMIFELSQDSIKALSLDSVQLKTFSSSSPTNVVDDTSVQQQLDSYAAGKPPLNSDERQPLRVTAEAPAATSSRVQSTNPLNETKQSTFYSMIEAYTRMKF